MSSICLQQALSAATKNIASPSARIDAETLLMYILKKNRAYLYAYPEGILSEEQHSAYQQLIDLRIAGHPVAYLTGKREFWSMQLQVTPDTLIPRPHSECIIEVILNKFAPHTTLNILELGAGSGAIACAIAHEKPNWHITSGDISLSALQIAINNSQLFKLNNINFIHSDWFQAISKEKKFDLIVSNPPYIAANDPHLKCGDLRFEPQNALVGGLHGHESLQHIIQHSHEYLTDNGCLVLEHGFQQRTIVMGMMHAAGYSEIHCTQDTQGLDRVTLGTYSST